MAFQKTRLQRYIATVNTNPYRRNTQTRTKIASVCKRLVITSLIGLLLGYGLALLLQGV